MVEPHWIHPQLRASWPYSWLIHRVPGAWHSLAHIPPWFSTAGLPLIGYVQATIKTNKIQAFNTLQALGYSDTPGRLNEVSNTLLDERLFARRAPVVAWHGRHCTWCNAVRPAITE